MISAYRLHSLLLAAFLLLATLAATPSLASSVEGTVFDRSGNRVPGVSVAIEAAEGGPRQTAYTNRDGRFVFYDFQPGPHIIEVYWGQDLVYRQEHELLEFGSLDIRL